jgi:hypothetical protein
MVNYMRLANRANLGFWRTWYSFEVYRYAFNEARGSTETKLMVGGFVGMFVFLFGGMGLAMLLD